MMFSLLSIYSFRSRTSEYWKLAAFNYWNNLPVTECTAGGTFVDMSSRSRKETREELASSSAVTDGKVSAPVSS